MHPRASRPILIVLALTAAVAAGAAVARAPEPDSLRYSMHFGGFHVVDLRFEQERTDRAYEAGLEIRTTGLADMVVRYQGKAAVEGRVADDGLRPERYGFRYASRKSERTVEVDYDPASGDATRVRSEKRGKKDKIEVPRELWQGVQDPLSAFLALREHIRTERVKGRTSFTAEVFDGRRRYTFAARIKRTIPRDGRPDAIEVEATVRPIAGFDLDDMSPREQREGYRLLARFSDDDLLLPLEVRTLNTKIAVIIRLAGCTGQACATAGADQGRRAG